MSGACNEYASMADVEHMERTFEERCAPELAIIDQLEQMGTSVPELIDTQTSEMAQKCVDILEQGFTGSFEELKVTARVELGIDVDKPVKKPLSCTSIPKVHSKVSKKVDYDTKQFSQDQVEKISSEMKGKMPRFLRDKLADPSKQLTKKELRRLPDGVKITLRDIEFGKRTFSLEKELDGKQVAPIGNRKPMNARFANHVMFENVPEPNKKGEKVDPPPKGSEQAKKVEKFRTSCPNGITFDEEAYPVGYAEHSQGSVTCDDLTGIHDEDLKKFDDVFGIDEKFRKEHDLTWEHDKDGKTGHLIPRQVHGHFAHTGGAARLRAKSKK